MGPGDGAREPSGSELSGTAQGTPWLTTTEPQGEGHAGEGALLQSPEAQGQGALPLTRPDLRLVAFHLEATLPQQDSKSNPVHHSLALAETSPFLFSGLSFTTGWRGHPAGLPNTVTTSDGTMLHKQKATSTRREDNGPTDSLDSLPRAVNTKHPPPPKLQSPPSKFCSHRGQAFPHWDSWPSRYSLATDPGPGANLLSSPAVNR